MTFSANVHPHSLFPGFRPTFFHTAAVGSHDFLFRDVILRFVGGIIPIVRAHWLSLWAVSSLRFVAQCWLVHLSSPQISVFNKLEGHSAPREVSKGGCMTGRWKGRRCPSLHLGHRVLLTQCSLGLNPTLSLMGRMIWVMDWVDVSLTASAPLIL